MSQGVNVGHTEVVGATDKALRVQLKKEDSPRWIPKSVIHADSEVYREDSEPGDLVLEQWFAEKEGLE